MTEKTVTIDWTPLVLAILLAPAIASCGMVVVSLIVPPVMPLILIFAVGSMMLGYLGYLLLGAPLMILAQLLGADHPVLHAGIGFGAVTLIPLGHAVGLPLEQGPRFIELGLWFGPIWCATAAVFYAILRRELGVKQEQT